MDFHRAVLDNGLQIVGETSRTARSVALGFFVQTGARDEIDAESGVTHFLEHMIFKGTERRTFLDVNRDFDRMGADYNAFTSVENTVFHAAILPEYLPQAVDLLSDILRPSIRQEDFDMEKNVIIEEIGYYEDRPAAIASDYAQRHYYGKHNLGRSVLGTKESVAALTREQMTDYFQRRYVAPNVIVAGAGALDWEWFVELIRQHCSQWPTGAIGREGVVEARGAGQFQVMARESAQQEHVFVMSPGPAADSRMRFAMQTMGVALGDETGSRLYWELVDPGLVESVGSGLSKHQGTGTFCSVLSCEPAQVEENLCIVQRVYEDVQKNNFTEPELQQAKNKILSSLVRSSELPENRMRSLGRNWTYLGEHRSVDDDLHAYDSVTLDDVRDVLDRYPLTELTTFAFGPLTQIRSPGGQTHHAEKPS